jgi:hypothetical protein
LGKSPLTGAQATAIANAWLAAYSNITNKVEVELRSVRDANGRALPLHQVRADGNLYVPELAVRGQQLSSGPVAGTNQFYIVETVYKETAAGDVRLVLHLDNYADAVGAELARLKLAYDAASRARGRTGSRSRQVCQWSAAAGNAAAGMPITDEEDVATGNDQ